MPSTIVHLAFAGLIAAALLGEAFDRKSVLIVMAVVAFPDLDSFIDLFAPYGHRVVFHNIWIPMLAGFVVFLDVYVREESYILDRWGEWGYRVAWVSIFCYLVAHVLLDMADGSVNLFWPVHDQFYTLSGEIELSNQHGIVQTFIEWGNGNGTPTPEARGSTEDVDITTGVAPGEAPEPEADPERTFPVIGATWELILFLTGTFVTAMRFHMEHDLENGESDDE